MTGRAAAARPARARASAVCPARCEVMITLSRPRQPAVGRAAVRRRRHRVRPRRSGRCRSAAVRASSSTSEPRAVLIRIGGGFHRAQCIAVDDPAGGGVGSGVQAQVVGGGDRGVAVDELHAGVVGIGVGGVDQHGHAERSPELGDGASAGPVAQRARVAPRSSCPASRGHVPARTPSITARRRRAAISINAIVSSATASWLTPGVLHTRIPARRGSGDVDRVVAHAAAGDDLQFACLVEHFGGDGLAGHDGAGDTVEQGERFVGRPLSDRRVIADLVTVACATVRPPRHRGAGSRW